MQVYTVEDDRAGLQASEIYRVVLAINEDREALICFRNELKKTLTNDGDESDVATLSRIHSGVLGNGFVYASSWLSFDVCIQCQQESLKKYEDAIIKLASQFHVIRYLEERRITEYYGESKVVTREFRVLNDEVVLRYG